MAFCATGGQSDPKIFGKIFFEFSKNRRPEVVMAVDLLTVGIRTRGDPEARRADGSPRGGSQGPEGPPRTWPKIAIFDFRVFGRFQQAADGE